MSNCLFKTFHKNLRIIILGLFVTGLLLSMSLPAMAQDANALAKEANKALRDSQRMMFNRKFEESQQLLDKAAELIEKIKAIDPNFKQLKSLEGKYEKQKKDLEKRLPKEPQKKTDKAKPGKKPNDAAKELDIFAKDANKALGDSQRMMFNRKFEESQQLLDKAAESIEKIKAFDPNASQLKSLESKYTKQKRDLEKRLPKAEKPAPDASHETAPTGAEKLDKLPKNIIRTFEDIDNILQEVEQLFGSITMESSDWEITNLGNQINAANSQIERLLKYESDKISTDHPEIQSRQEKIDKFQGKFDEFKASYAATKEQATQEKTVLLQEAQADGEQLLTLYEQHSSKFEGIYGATLVYGSDVEEVKAQLAKIESLEKEVLPVLQPVLAKTAEKYGTTSMDINNTLHELGMPSSEQFGTEFERLYESVGNVVKSRKATAESIASEGKKWISDFDFLVSDIRVKKLQEVKTLLQAGQKFDPNNQDINRMLAMIDDKIAEVAENIEKDIDAKTWSGHIDNFAGPGEPKALAQAALEYFRNHSGWGNNPDKHVEVLAVAVRGQWDVAETNIFGQVIQWRLPIHLAITDEKLKPKNVARVYELSVLTVQGVPDEVKKAPPFNGYWVGNSWMMRLNKLP